VYFTQGKLIIYFFFILIHLNKLHIWYARLPSLERQGVGSPTSPTSILEVWLIYLKGNFA